jgi:hypothetical protein
MIYSFNTNLLSAAKISFNPSRPSNSVSLSGDGVNVISLSTDDVGIAFNKSEIPLSTVLINTTVQGSLFRIDRVYHGSQMTLLKNNGTSTIFQFSSGGSVGIALSANYTQFTTPETRRKWVYGYR